MLSCSSSSDAPDLYCEGALLHVCSHGNVVIE
jgi:hypothetical protein